MKDCPNIDQALIGCCSSGKITEWPGLIAEIKYVVDQRNEFERKLITMTRWLERNAPEVFQRGLWDVLK